MNRWSEARIEPVLPGDGGHVASVGARRDVHLPPTLGRRAVLREVVIESEAPGRFGYRVVGGAPVRHHEGRIRIAPDEAGARLRWTVEIEVAHRLMEAALRRTLLPSLERSLDALVAIASSGEPAEPPPVRALEEEERSAAALVDARATLEAQEALLLAQDRDDPRRWFTEVYAFVTDELIRAVLSGAIRHPAWVLRLVPGFHRYYADALASPSPESHWRDAFRKMDRAFDRHRPLDAVGYCILQGMRAHIDEDLPRVLAEVYRSFYAGRCDYARLRGDYYSLAPAFARASERMLDAIPASYWRARDLIARRVPPELRALRRPSGYDLIRARNAAFERGARIAALLEA